MLNPLTVSNGAVMFPNTFNMQELNRMFSDFTLDWEDEGFEAETPFIYTIARGKERIFHSCNRYLF